MSQQRCKSTCIFDNNQREDPPWYDLCLYVAQNAQRGSKGRNEKITRTKLVESATGKTGESARSDSRRLGDAGDVISEMGNVDHFDTDTNLTNHLSQISRLPEEAWAEDED